MSYKSPLILFFLLAEEKKNWAQADITFSTRGHREIPARVVVVDTFARKFNMLAPAFIKTTKCKETASVATNAAANGLGNISGAPQLTSIYSF